MGEVCEESRDEVYFNLIMSGRLLILGLKAEQGNIYKGLIVGCYTSNK